MYYTYMYIISILYFVIYICIIHIFILYLYYILLYIYVCIILLLYIYYAYIYLYVLYIWVNYNDLTATSLVTIIMVNTPSGLNLG